MKPEEHESASLVTGDVPASEIAPTRWEFLRDVVVFQGKLLIDGLRDAVLIPISLIAAAMDLISGGVEKNQYFYDVVHFGRRSERLINLFGAASRVPMKRGDILVDEDFNIDQIVDRVEHQLKQQHDRGGLTAQTKTAIDRLLDVTERRGKRKTHEGDEKREDERKETIETKEDEQHHV